MGEKSIEDYKIVEHDLFRKSFNCKLLVGSGEASLFVHLFHTLAHRALLLVTADDRILARWTINLIYLLRIS